MSMPGSPQADRLEVLAALVAAYEEKHDPIDLPEPIEAIEASHERSWTIASARISDPQSTFSCSVDKG